MIKRSGLLQNADISFCVMSVSQVVRCDVNRCRGGQQMANSVKVAIIFNYMRSSLFTSFSSGPRPAGKMY